MRIKFEKGKQRDFLKRVMDLAESPSLRELARRLDFNYSSLKNYFSELRSLPEDLFKDLIYLSNLDSSSLNFERVGENWGQIIGGRKSKK
jgi:hypothetical protein